MSQDYDNNDTPSETESSDTHPSQRIYTPTSSTGMNPSSTVSADDRLESESDPSVEQEHTPLLPVVEDEKRRVMDSEAVEAGNLEDLNDKDVLQLDSDPKEPLLPAQSPHVHGRCRRRRFRQICLLLSVKVILLVGSLGWLGWFFGGVSLVSRHAQCIRRSIYIRSPSNYDDSPTTTNTSALTKTTTTTTPTLR